MRRKDKSLAMLKANILFEQRNLKSKGVIKETTINGRDEPKHPLVQLALYDDDIEGVREFLQQNGLNGVKSETIKHIMRKKGEYDGLEIIKLLMDAGADGSDALGSAACTGNLEIVKYLMSKGVDATADKNYAIRVSSGGMCPEGYPDGNHGMIAAILKQNGAVLPDDYQNDGMG